MHGNRLEYNVVGDNHCCPVQRLLRDRPLRVLGHDQQPVDDLRLHRRCHLPDGPLCQVSQMTVWLKDNSIIEVYTQKKKKEIYLF